MERKLYTLPKLPYDFKDLEPYISEGQLNIHYTKHHQAYVNKANSLVQQLDESRMKGTEVDFKAIAKELSFNLGGHLLHSLFWENMAPAGEGKRQPTGPLSESIDRQYGGFDRFRKEFSQIASTAEGSAWAALSVCRETGRLTLFQIEKHNVNIAPAYSLILVLDVWEHAYYLDYRNERPKFIEAFWNIVDWDEVGRRFSEIQKGIV